MCFLSVFADVGADILDLAETMITSNGLQYEPVSKTCLRTLGHVWLCLKLFRFRTQRTFKLFAPLLLHVFSGDFWTDSKSETVAKVSKQQTHLDMVFLLLRFRSFFFLNSFCHSFFITTTIRHWQDKQWNYSVATTFLKFLPISLILGEMDARRQNFKCMYWWFGFFEALKTLLQITFQFTSSPTSTLSLFILNSIFCD